MRVISVTIENFLSIEKAHVDFDDAGLLLIEGYNYDVDRANGAGKTAILNALSFGLYDKLPRKVTASELLRRGTKRGSVTVTVACGDDILAVKRCRPKGVSFYKQVDGELVELTITQQEWENKLRLTYSQFIVSMYCSQSTSTFAPRFLLLNDSDKKQFLLQLLDLEDFSLCKKKADEKVAFLVAETTNTQHAINNLQAKIDAFSESIVDVSTVKLELAEKENTLIRLHRALEEQESVNKPDLAKFQKLEGDIAVKKTEFTKLRAQREMLMRQWQKLGTQIKPFDATDTCPMCGTELDNTHAKAVHETEMAKLTAERQSLKEKIDSIDVSLANEAKIDDLAVKVAERKRKESAAYEQACYMKMDITAKISAVTSSIENLKKKLNDNEQLVGKVNALREQQKALQTKLVELSQETELQKTVASIYSPTGAQAYVLDSAVALFNEQIAKYVNILWSNLTYELQSYKETVRGDVTAKFSESIVMDGRPISLGSLSGGELRALSVCADMALIGLLEKQFGISMSPIIFDEAFDGLDAAGKEFALELIKDLAKDRQVVVIDHASEMRSAFDKVLRVEKRNGVSTVAMLQ